jgi:hypothetical protein
MGYFPNGTAGDMYEADYCNKCINEDEEKGCPIMMLHLMWNYDAVDPKTAENKARRQALEAFIPTDREGWNQQCRMFKAR